ncbi:hypothetical protein FRC01_003697 [Tulasnella sp. 417]|nr:hypothetical protein FRC01_003697 [Tulasnella sp. 417]
MDYISQLPIDLFIPIIFLSFDTPDAVDRLIRTEKLRLVNKPWRAAIDSTPLFWSCIPNVARSFPRTIPRWIRNSGEVPLHVISTRHSRPLDEFMQSVIPHRHRWRKLEIAAIGNSISKYINEPAPMLEELVISHAILSSNIIAFGGVTPSLSSVDLSRVVLPENTQFLRNLKRLRLRSVEHTSGDLDIGRLRHILNVCPGLMELELDVEYINDGKQQPPIVLDQLSSFRLIGTGRTDSVCAILGAIIAPRLADFYFRWNRRWVPPGLNVHSPLSSSFLGIQPRYRISVTKERFVLCTSVAQPDTQWYPNVFVELSSGGQTGEAAVRLLHSFAKAAPRSAILGLALCESPSARAILEYLISAAESKDTKLDDLIPQLQSIRLDIEGRTETSTKNLLADLAQVGGHIRWIRLCRMVGRARAELRIVVPQLLKEKCFAERSSMDSTSKAVDHLSQLPIELFIRIIFLSFDTSVPVNRIIRTEKLRLVNKAWQAAIDSTPLFWSCIPNPVRSIPDAISRWIRKSGEVPLDVNFTEFGGNIGEFMQFLIPHRHRWRKLSITGTQGDSISQYINKPAPILEELIISSAPLSPDTIAFGGIAPFLSSVELSGVMMPEDTQFLRNLNCLQLTRIKYPPGTSPIHKLCDILNACPGLEKLKLDACYMDLQGDQPPTTRAGRGRVVLDQLSSLHLRDYGRANKMSAILGAVIAPRLDFFFLSWHQTWAPSGLNVVSPLSTSLLGIHELQPRYQISVVNGRFVLSKGVVEPKTQWYPTVVVQIAPIARRGGAALKLLQSFEKGAPRGATVDVALHDYDSTHAILLYLKSTVETTDGKLDHPIPQIQSIQLDIGGEDEFVARKNLLVELALTRRNIPRITLRIITGRAGHDWHVQVYQWDPVASKFEFRYEGAMEEMIALEEGALGKWPHWPMKYM